MNTPASPVRRVLYVHHASDLGGASLSLAYLIQRLDRRRYDPAILFNCIPGSAALPFAEQGVRIHQDPSISTYPHARGAWLGVRSLRPWECVTLALKVRGSARRFRRFLETHPSDIVHLNSLVQVPAALGAKAAGVPVVWHIREEIHPGYLGLRRAWVRRCVRRCAAGVVAISHQNAKALGLARTVSVVYNFVDFKVFNRGLSDEAFRRSAGLPADVPLVGMLGGIVDSKGADVFVEAAVRVRRLRPEVLFLIAGLPPQEESPSRVKRCLRHLVEASGMVPSVEHRVQALLARHELEKSVLFVGMRRDVPEMLAACAMLVWPATVSHFARPILEAGAMARPVVASDFASSREIVVEGKTGLLVPPRDPACLADAILRLLADPQRARCMGEAGFALARERYDARRNAAAILRIYDGITASGPGGAGS